MKKLNFKKLLKEVCSNDQIWWLQNSSKKFFAKGSYNKIGKDKHFVGYIRDFQIFFDTDDCENIYNSCVLLGTPKNEFTCYKHVSDKESLLKLLSYRVSQIFALVDVEHQNKMMKEAQRDKEIKVRNKKKILQENVIGIYENLFDNINKGANWKIITPVYGDENLVKCRIYEEKYCNSCKFLKVVRNFYIQVKKGFCVKNIGGLITFYKKGLNPYKGCRCTWFIQDREFSTFHAQTGYVIKNQHIEAKSLKEAKEINKENRKEMLRLILKRRAKERKILEQRKEVLNRWITIENSLKSGNCLPGTMEFKKRVEAILGKEVTKMRLCDVLKFGEKFGLSYYTNRILTRELTL